MRITRWAGAAVLAAAMCAGCQNQSKSPVPPPPPPVNEATIEKMKQLAPDAIIGRVAAVLAESRLAALADVPADKMQSGDTVVFYGAGDVIVGGGAVVDVVNGAVHVRYTEPAAGQRAPAVGDIAVKFQQP